MATNFTIHGFLGLSAYSGILIQLSHDGDRARCVYTYETGHGVKYSRRNRWQDIKHTHCGEAFVVFRGRRYKLCDFMKFTTLETIQITN